MRAISMIQFMLDSQSPFTAQAKEEVDTFVKKSKEYSGKEEDRLKSIGLPSVHIFNRWIVLCKEKWGAESTHTAELDKFCTKCNNGHSAYCC